MAIKMGHKRIAFIHGERTTVTENRLIGFHRACEEAGIPINDTWIRESRYHDPDRCGQIVEQLIRKKNRPTCILLPDDFSAIGGINVIREAGMSIPEDISIAGYDGIGLSQVLDPRLSTWKQDTEQLGRLSVTKLVKLIEHPKTTVASIETVKGSFIEGTSMAPFTQVD